MNTSRRTLLRLFLAAPFAGVAGWLSARLAKAKRPRGYDEHRLTSGFHMDCTSMGAAYDDDGVYEIWADGKSVWRRA